MSEKIPDQTRLPETDDGRRMRSRTENLVLGTVNAPWKRSVTAEELAKAIIETDTSQWLSHIVTFFTEVSVDLVMDFSRIHDIDPDSFSKCYEKTKELTGEKNPLLEVRFLDEDRRFSP